jgi:K+-sensing histidine kinase KdpD
MSNRASTPINFPAILASSVHDLKNSLALHNALIAKLQLNYPGANSPEFKQLEFESKRMNANLMQLLILYKIDAELYHLNTDLYPAADILTEVAAQQAFLQTLGAVGLSTECDTDLLCYCDYNLMVNAISTLVNNAQRYCRKRILLSAYESEDGYVVFSVEDDGDGYSEDHLSACSGLDTLGPDTGNTGLGLFFVAAITHMHINGPKQGYIKTDNCSRLGGARCRLYLP